MLSDFCSKKIIQGREPEVYTSQGSEILKVQRLCYNQTVYETKLRKTHVKSEQYSIKVPRVHLDMEPKNI